jgi:hypothetical protein
MPVYYGSISLINDMKAGFLVRASDVHEAREIVLREFTDPDTWIEDAIEHNARRAGYCVLYALRPDENFRLL